MLDYAKISKMREYANHPFFDFQETHLLIRGKLKAKIKNLLSFFPIDDIRIQDNKILKNFRYRGTRGWEYPWVLEQIINKQKGIQKCLDAGCGVSLFPCYLSQLGYDVYGLDHFVEKSKDGYGIGRKHRKKYGRIVKFINGDMSKIPFPDNYFDVVYNISVMEHIVIEGRGDLSIHKKCLAELKRVLRPSGLLISTYDTFLDKSVCFGWDFVDDILFLNMNLSININDLKHFREKIIYDEDTFYIPPDLFFYQGYGRGMNIRENTYHKMTSVGYVLKK